MVHAGWIKDLRGALGMLAFVFPRRRPSALKWRARLLVIAPALFLAAPLARAGSEGCTELIPTTGCTVNGVVGPCVGTDGPDRIEGTDGNDVILAGGDKDVVRTGDGDDVICGGDGDDDLRKTGSGRVQIDGGPGRDRIRGGAANDVLLGGTDDDKITGGKGDDTILCGQGRNEKANGGGGEDGCQCARKAKCERTPSVPPPPTSTTIPGTATTTLVTATTTLITNSTSTLTTSTSSTSTTLCVPRTCEDAGVECGFVDDGCGGIANCAPCPIGKSLCIEGTCKDSCIETPDFTKCDSDGSECTLEYCSLEGVCEVAAVTECSPGPCHTSASCNPNSGGCEESGYLGDLTPCRYGDDEPFGRCASGNCAVGKECVIDGEAWDVDDRNPNNSCQACQPALGRAEWTMVDNGIACPGGICANETCSNTVCFAAYALRNPGDVNPANTCQVCNPDLKLSGWSPGPNGKPCPNGLCVAGVCNGSSCVIDGVVYENGARNPAQTCQACDISKSRTSWTTLADFTGCRVGCFVGQCSLTFGGCVIAGTGCPATACADGVCGNDGNCLLFPSKLPGTACTEVSQTGCTESQGTCNLFGFCVRNTLPGKACTPDQTINPCLVNPPSGTCDSAGNCVPNALPNNTPCTPLRVAPCTRYKCFNATCFPEARPCPVLSDDHWCRGGDCNPDTDSCEYNTSVESGRLTCSGEGSRICCDNQFCASPPECGGAFCILTKRCYSFGSYIPP